LPPPFNETSARQGPSLTDKLALVPEGLSKTETSVFRLLTPDSPTHVDSLVDKSKLSFSELTEALLALEMRELVRALPGRCFVRKI
jgi:predicted Rossmann fold nucleotide-binding protein DprA/Smf involved in DNA uptake